MARWEHKTKILLGLVLSLCVGLAACGEDDTFGEIEEGSLSTNGPISFDLVELDDKDTETLTVENNSDSSPLVIYSAELQEFDSSDGDDYDDKRELRPVGDSWDETDIEVAPNESKEFELEYQPRNTTVDEGVIVLSTNTAENDGIREVDVETEKIAPELTPQPSEVDFGRVESGEEAERFVTIRNDGTAPLRVSDVWGSGSAEFSLSFPEVRADEEDEDEIPPREEDSDEWTDVLEPDEEFLVRVTFSPGDDLPKDGRLNLESNDPESGTTQVPLSGNSGAPCLAVPDAVDFDNGSLEQTNSRSVSIENCSRTEELEVSNIEITDDGGGVFSLDEDSLPGDLADGDVATIDTAEREDFTINFDPDAEEEFTGELLVESNDNANEEARIELVGVGSDNQCPIADFDASVEGGRSYGPGGHIDALPLDTVEFDGSASEDQDDDGSIERYEWTILERPQDSTQRMQPNDEAESELFLDVAGTYEIELNVYDNENAGNCDDAIITIEAKPEDDIHVQLVWDTPSDPDQTDGFGTDLDLHYLHPNGRWNNAPWDIYWRNLEADWGVQDDPSDDPSLDIDDTDGAGPENVNHSKPENVTYRTGVYYYDANGFGESYATVRIFVEGQMVRELENKPMAETGVFWDVATIDWPEGDVTVVDRISDGFP